MVSDRVFSYMWYLIVLSLTCGIWLCLSCRLHGTRDPLTAVLHIILGDATPLDVAVMAGIKATPTPAEAAAVMDAAMSTVRSAAGEAQYHKQQQQEKQQEAVVEGVGGQRASEQGGGMEDGTEQQHAQQRGGKFWWCRLFKKQRKEPLLPLTEQRGGQPGHTKRGWGAKPPKGNASKPGATKAAAGAEADVPFVCVASQGFLGDVLGLSERLRWMGPLRYDIAGFVRFLLLRSYPATIWYLPAEELPGTSCHANGNSSTSSSSSSSANGVSLGSSSSKGKVGSSSVSISTAGSSRSSRLGGVGVGQQRHPVVVDATSSSSSSSRRDKRGLKGLAFPVLTEESSVEAAAAAAERFDQITTSTSSSSSRVVRESRQNDGVGEGASSNGIGEEDGRSPAEDTIGPFLATTSKSYSTITTTSSSSSCIGEGDGRMSADDMDQPLLATTSNTSAGTSCSTSSSSTTTTSSSSTSSFLAPHQPASPCIAQRASYLSLSGGTTIGTAASVGCSSPLSRSRQSPFSGLMSKASSLPDLSAHKKYFLSPSFSRALTQPPKPSPPASSPSALGISRAEAEQANPICPWTNPSTAPGPPSLSNQSQSILQSLKHSGTPLSPRSLGRGWWFQRSSPARRQVLGVKGSSVESVGCFASCRTCSSAALLRTQSWHELQLQQHQPPELVEEQKLGQQQQWRAEFGGQEQQGQQQQQQRQHLHQLQQQGHNHHQQQQPPSLYQQGRPEAGCANSKHGVSEVAKVARPHHQQEQQQADGEEEKGRGGQPSILNSSSSSGSGRNAHGGSSSREGDVESAAAGAPGPGWVKLEGRYTSIMCVVTSCRSDK